MTDRRQPDRTRGIFETLLVVAGEPVELEAHLRRLACSLEEAYLQDLPAQADEQLRRAAEGIDLGRLRLTAVPAHDGLRIDLLAGGVKPAIVFPSAGVELRSHPVPGGLGPHKWVHRPGINRPGTDEAGALIIDEGEVLEAGWANVFAVRGGTLFTPPLDGRLLPGTTRAALLALAAEAEIETREEPFQPSDLLDADETFLTGSIRGIEPALELDGQPLAGCGAISDRLASALRQRWGLPSDRDAPRSSAAAPKLGQLSQ
jgi:branched-subunit amino acid aminotransferase/4-amino-4-deoxychorismate lyase